MDPDSEVQRWTDEVVRLCDQIIQTAERVSSLEKWWASSVIARWWRGVVLKWKVLKWKDVCLELRLFPGVGVEFMEARERFESGSNFVITDR